MTTRTKTKRQQLVTYDVFRERQERKLDQRYLSAMKSRRYEVALGTIVALLQLYNIPIDGPLRPGSAPTFSREAVQHLMTAVEAAQRRRDS